MSRTTPQPTHLTHTPDGLHARRYNPYGVLVGVAATKNGVGGGSNPIPNHPHNSPTTLEAHLGQVEIDQPHHPHPPPNQPPTTSRAYTHLQPLDPSLFTPPVGSQSERSSKDRRPVAGGGGRFPPIQPSPPTQHAWSEDTQPTHPVYAQPFLAPLPPSHTQPTPTPPPNVPQYPQYLVQQHQQKQWEAAYQHYLAQYTSAGVAGRPHSSHVDVSSDEKIPSPRSVDQQTVDLQQARQAAEYASMVQLQQQQAALAQATALYQYGHQLHHPGVGGVGTFTQHPPPSKPAPDQASTFAWLKKHELEASRILRGERIGRKVRPRNGRVLEGEVSEEDEFVNQIQTQRLMFGTNMTERAAKEYKKKTPTATSKKRSSKRKSSSGSTSPIRKLTSQQGPVGGGGGEGVVVNNNVWNDEEKSSTVPTTSSEQPTYMRSTYSYAKGLEANMSTTSSVHGGGEQQHHPHPPTTTNNHNQQHQQPHPHPPSQPMSEKAQAEAARARAARFALRARQLKVKMAKISNGKTLERKKVLLETEQSEKEARIQAYRSNRGMKSINRTQSGLEEDEFRKMNETELAALGGVTLTYPSNRKTQQRLQQHLSTNIHTSSLSKLPTMTLEHELEALKKLEENVKRELAKRRGEDGEAQVDGANDANDGGASTLPPSSSSEPLTDSLLDDAGNRLSTDPSIVNDPVLQRAREERRQRDEEATEGQRCLEEEQSELERTEQCERDETEQQRLNTLEHDTQVTKSKLESKKFKKQQESEAKALQRAEAERLENERRLAKQAELEKERARELRKLEAKRLQMEQVQSEFAARSKERQAKLEAEKKAAEDAKIKEEARTARRLARRKEEDEAKKEKAFQARLKLEKEELLRTHALNLLKQEAKQRREERQQQQQAQEDGPQDGDGSAVVDGGGGGDDSSSSPVKSSPSNSTPTSPSMKTRRSVRDTSPMKKPASNVSTTSTPKKTKIPNDKKVDNNPTTPKTTSKKKTTMTNVVATPLASSKKKSKTTVVATPTATPSKKKKVNNDNNNSEATTKTTSVDEKTREDESTMQSNQQDTNSNETVDEPSSSTITVVENKSVDDASKDNAAAADGDATPSPVVASNITSEPVPSDDSRVPPVESSSSPDDVDDDIVRSTSIDSNVTNVINDDVNDSKTIKATNDDEDLPIEDETTTSSITTATEEANVESTTTKDEEVEVSKKTSEPTTDAADDGFETAPVSIESDKPVTNGVESVTIDDAATQAETHEAPVVGATEKDVDEANNGTSVKPVTNESSSSTDTAAAPTATTVVDGDTGVPLFDVNDNLTRPSTAEYLSDFSMSDMSAIEEATRAMSPLGYEPVATNNNNPASTNSNVVAPAAAAAPASDSSSTPLTTSSASPTIIISTPTPISPSPSSIVPIVSPQQQPKSNRVESVPETETETSASAAPARLNLLDASETIVAPFSPSNPPPGVARAIDPTLRKELEQELDPSDFDF